MSEVCRESDIGVTSVGYQSIVGLVSGRVSGKYGHQKTVVKMKVKRNLVMMEKYLNMKDNF